MRLPGQQPRLRRGPCTGSSRLGCSALAPCLAYHRAVIPRKMYFWVQIFNSSLAQVQAAEAALGKTLLHLVLLFIAPTVQSQEMLPPPPAPRRAPLADPMVQHYRRTSSILSPHEPGGAFAPAKYLLSPPPVHTLGGRVAAVEGLTEKQHREQCQGPGVGAGSFPGAGASGAARALTCSGHWWQGA